MVAIERAGRIEPLRADSFPACSNAISEVANYTAMTIAIRSQPWLSRRSANSPAQGQALFNAAALLRTQPVRRQLPSLFESEAMGFLSDFENNALPFEAVSRFDPCFDVYGLSLKERMGKRDRTITLMARSPASPVARALAINLARFEPGSLRIGIIFAQIGPVEAMDFMIEAIRASSSQRPEAAIRWMRNRALLDAHERLTLGSVLCWTGDSMRRAEDQRPAIDRVEDATPSMMAEAHASFGALWKASRQAPASVFRPPVRPQPANIRAWAALTAASEATPISNVVPLEDYLRLRRH
jgi:hypothetical protein